jgi:pimeloyl-ACP methyl ester carboxylesterase
MGRTTRAAAAIGLLSLAAAGALPACATAPRVARPAVEEYRLAADDGTPLAFDLRGTEGPFVVLIHGWRCDRALWLWTAADLARDHRVVCLDLAGHGESGAGHAEWSVEALAADVSRVVEALRIDRVVLVGHSMGGPVALAAARRLPGRVAGVVGVDTLHDAGFVLPKEAIEGAMAAFDADPEKALRDFLPSMLAPGTDPALLDWIVARALLADDRATAALMRAFTGLDAAALLRDAGVPVRCVNAAPGATPFAMPTAVETNRRYADFDAVLLQGVGHYPMIERPFEFAVRLREVLSGLR